MVRVAGQLARRLLGLQTRTIRSGTDHGGAGWIIAFTTRRCGLYGSNRSALKRSSFFRRIGIHVQQHLKVANKVSEDAEVLMDNAADTRQEAIAWTLKLYQWFGLFLSCFLQWGSFKWAKNIGLPCYLSG